MNLSEAEYGLLRLLQFDENLIKRFSLFIPDTGLKYGPDIRSRVTDVEDMFTVMNMCKVLDYPYIWIKGGKLCILNKDPEAIDNHRGKND